MVSIPVLLNTVQHQDIKIRDCSLWFHFHYTVIWHIESFLLSFLIEIHESSSCQSGGKNGFCELSTPLCGALASGVDLLNSEMSCKELPAMLLIFLRGFLQRLEEDAWLFTPTLLSETLQRRVKLAAPMFLFVS
ncbi:hypothetical protein OJAV_G00116520 [Oryzias javanicus]|uniref:Uncharacterized protein n=1 Tax=Oryzias javanicus TaxID=123683 RepID=A0A3S2U8Q4_ORYJA|nr:hypothetical protein OJAV_G00116520 [Oryzias javanicus]